MTMDKRGISALLLLQHQLGIRRGFSTRSPCLLGSSDVRRRWLNGRDSKRTEAPGHEGFWRPYVVDFVDRAYVSAFIDKHFLPCVQDFAARAISVERILVETKGQVPDLHS
jgi:hypothetical protein